MFVIDEKKILHFMRNIYKTRLTEAMNEVDIFDSRGNMVLGNDLKVHHKDSGYEYTVAGVEVDPMGDNTKVILRLPDEPRIEPQAEEEIISDAVPPETLAEDDIATTPEVIGDFTPPKDKKDRDDGHEVVAAESGDDVLFVVDKDEFEKEYEVK